MGGHRSEDFGRSWQRRRRQHFKQEQERRLGNSGAAGPCVRIDPESGQRIGLVERPDTGPAEITHPAPALAVEPVSEATILCPHCDGTGRVRPDIDLAALVAVLADAFGDNSIMTADIMARASHDDRLRAVLAGKNAVKVGKVLERIAMRGLTYDGLTIIRLPLTELGSAVWKVVFR